MILTDMKEISKFKENVLNGMESSFDLYLDKEINRLCKVPENWNQRMVLALGL